MNRYSAWVLLSLMILNSGGVLAQDADPTRPPARVQSYVAPMIEVANLQLTSIWYREGDAERQSTAVINGQRLVVGDRVAEYEVVLIEPDQVTLNSNDGEVRLRVFRSSSLTIERH